MKVAIYSRFSTDSQDATSIAGQVANCEALAAQKGLQVVATFQDQGQSGNDDSRPDYQALLTRLNAGDFMGIVCDETSRITRNQAELHRLTAELDFCDQFLITCDGIDTREESSELVLAVKAAVDAMEGRKIGFRTYRSLRERHKAGNSAGGRIYGYSSEKDGKYRRRIVDGEQAAIVCEIYQCYADGESAKTIVRALNERGVPSPGSYWKNRKRRAAGWVHTTLLGSHSKASGILRNPIYKGSVTWNKRAGKKRPGTGKRVQRRRPESEWIEHKDESLRIVSDDLWNRVQKRLQRARDATSVANRRGRPPKYLLSGLLVCASCGGHYTVRNGRSYACTSQANGRDAFCNQRQYIFRPKVERELLAGIKSQLLEPDVIEAMTAEITRQARTDMDRTDAIRKLKSVEQQIENVVDSLASVGQSDALTARLRSLEVQKAMLIERSAEAAPIPLLTGVSDTWKQIVSDLENLREYAKPDEVDTARELLRQIVGEVEIKEEPDGVFAYTMLNTASGYKGGAEKRT